MVNSPTFTFPVIVNGNKLTATVLGEEGEGRDFHYRVLFNDRYEDVFHKVNDKLIGLRGVSSQPYADAIQFDIVHYIGLDTDRLWYVFQNEGENVWIFEGEEEDEEENVYTTYNVHVKGKYQFHLVRVADGWMVSTRSELQQVDMKLAERVEDVLIAIL